MANRTHSRIPLALTCLLFLGSPLRGQDFAHTPADLGGQGQDNGGGLLGRLAPAHWMDKAKQAVGLGPDEQLAKQLFQEAEAKYQQAIKATGDERQKGCLEAAKQYRKAAARWPDSMLEEDSLFMAGEAYFFADHYPEAEESYELLIKKHMNTRYMDVVDARRFAIAQYWIQHYERDPELVITPNLFDDGRPLFDKFGHGIRVFNKIRLDDPTGKLADDATMAAAAAHFKRGRYLQADELLDDLRKSFPNSQHQFQAHLLGVQCKLRLYQGPQYSRQPLDEAEQLIKQLSRQFPDQVQSELEYLTRAWKDVRLKKAEYDWSVARYYDRRGDYAAARHYYAHIRHEYADTSLAAEATSRLEKIAGKPDKPEQPLPWLVRMFPSSETQQPLLARSPLTRTRR